MVEPVTWSDDAASADRAQRALMTSKILQYIEKRLITAAQFLLHALIE